MGTFQSALRKQRNQDSSHSEGSEDHFYPVADADDDLIEFVPDIQHNQLTSFSLENSEIKSHLHRWEKVHSHEDRRLARSGHGITVHDSVGYVFGGQVRNQGIPDLVCFDLKTLKWSPIRTKGFGPFPRTSAAICKGPYEGTFIVAGGASTHGLVYSDLFEFNVYSRQWRKLKHRADASFCKFYGQSVRSYGSSLIFFGGFSGGAYSNAVYMLDVESGEGSYLNTTGHAPSPRYKQEMVIIDHSMYIIGGSDYTPTINKMDVFILDLQALVWKQVSTSGPIPECRTAHSCVVDDKMQRLYVWGGYSGSLKRLDDGYMLDLQSNMWTQLFSFTNEVTPAPRAFHCSCFFEGAIYIFGGSDGESRHCDVWRYTLEENPLPLTELALAALGKNQMTMVDIEEVLFDQNKVKKTIVWRPPLSS
uniref:Attractin/MKLN-like beta-propeller domain-containing protein n=1 Tax=Fibrocapsa japonica TaxID=94617 RepID=A0A7S2UZD9_9STRA|mmetsp:Transcript_2167/g.3195  ORF Transcript_2167/g.3195 Transcript_2167/m.3195 type:complete len:419 (+) Transcript_2167:13-1269(+)